MKERWERKKIRKEGITENGGERRRQKDNVKREKGGYSFIIGEERKGHGKYKG